MLDQFPGEFPFYHPVHTIEEEEETISLAKLFKEDSIQEEMVLSWSDLKRLKGLPEHFPEAYDGERCYEASEVVRDRRFLDSTADELKTNPVLRQQPEKIDPNQSVTMGEDNLHDRNVIREDVLTWGVEENDSGEQEAATGVAGQLLTIEEFFIDAIVEEADGLPLLVSDDEESSDDEINPYDLAPRQYPWGPLNPWEESEESDDGYDSGSMEEDVPVPLDLPEPVPAWKPEKLEEARRQLDHLNAASQSLHEEGHISHSVEKPKVLSPQVEENSIEIKSLHKNSGESFEAFKNQMNNLEDGNKKIGKLVSVENSAKSQAEEVQHIEPLRPGKEVKDEEDWMILVENKHNEDGEALRSDTNSNANVKDNRTTIDDLEMDIESQLDPFVKKEVEQEDTQEAYSKILEVKVDSNSNINSKQEKRSTTLETQALDQDNKLSSLKSTNISLQKPEMSGEVYVKSTNLGKDVAGIHQNKIDLVGSQETLAPKVVENNHQQNMGYGKEKVENIIEEMKELDDYVTHLTAYNERNTEEISERQNMGVLDKESTVGNKQHIQEIDSKLNGLETFSTDKLMKAEENIETNVKQFSVLEGSSKNISEQDKHILETNVLRNTKLLGNEFQQLESEKSDTETDKIPGGREPKPHSYLLAGGLYRDMPHKLSTTQPGNTTGLVIPPETQTLPVLQNKSRLSYWIKDQYGISSYGTNVCWKESPSRQIARNRKPKLINRPAQS